MADVATLALVVDSSSVPAGTQALNALNAASTEAEARASAVSGAFRHLSDETATGGAGLRGYTREMQLAHEATATAYREVNILGRNFEVTHNEARSLGREVANLAGEIAGAGGGLRGAIAQLATGGLG